MEASLFSEEAGRRALAAMNGDWEPAVLERATSITENNSKDMFSFLS
ncbi:hypothetical protein J2847_005224 [Azospirillum agricola]|nr:hypothetical protein [Azospirillum agricola]MBP2231901.1 hypothetical protein [Azospirillum agricola]